MKLLVLLALLLPSFSYAECKKDNEPVKIAIIDTGFGYQNLGAGAKLCPTGHKSFVIGDKSIASHISSTKDNIPLDKHRHGTNLVGLIEREADKSGINYCIIVLKFYDPTMPGGNADALIDALKYAVTLKPDILNLSLGGDAYFKEEDDQITKLLDNGTIVVAAAGNEYANMDKKSYYPAMDDPRVVVVGNLNRDGSRADSSNYGSPVDRWEVGQDADGYGIVLSGTSQSTGVATGKIVGEKFNCEKNLLAIPK